MIWLECLPVAKREYKLSWAMESAFWPQFTILWILAVCGSMAILPYSIRMFSESGKSKSLKLPVRTLLLLSVLQSAVIFALAIFFGLILAHKIGLGAPYIEAFFKTTTTAQPIGSRLYAIGAGVLAGALLMMLDLGFLPYWPKPILDLTMKTTLRENGLASLYGGINEELIMRFFGVSLITWLLSKVWYTGAGLPTDAVFWVAIVAMAVLFALGHLPALKAVAGSISPVMLARTLVLNLPIGLLCGWLFWKYGIEAAILAHFTADIVYHVGGTMLLRRKTKAHNYA